jgi:hypothetical protein
MGFLKKYTPWERMAFEPEIKEPLRIVVILKTSILSVKARGLPTKAVVSSFCSLPQILT